MPVISSRIDPAAPDFAETRAANLEVLAEYERLMAESRAGGGEKYVTRHHERGKLMVRERIELLLDRDSPFLELSPLAAWGTNFPLSASVVTGIGYVNGVEVAISGHDPTIRGGSSRSTSPPIPTPVGPFDTSADGAERHQNDTVDVRPSPTSASRSGVDPSRRTQVR